MCTWKSLEIRVSGTGLARGYFKKSALTAERLSSKPFIKDAIARLYKPVILAVG